MQLIAISVVKNEADMIEAFVRHTLAWADRLLVIDHDSTDGTRDVLQSLRREGLPISIFIDHALANLQQARAQWLLELAVARHGADWVLPLDADEILCGPGRPALEDQLGRVPEGHLASVLLHDYRPSTQDDPAIRNPVQRIQHCRPQPGPTSKVMISRAMAGLPGFAVGKGCHGATTASGPVPAHPLRPEFRLAHFSLRSGAQQATRVVLAELQRLARGRRHAGLDVHYRPGFQLLSRDPQLFFQTVCQPAGKLARSPVAYQGGELRYTASASDEWSRLARALLPYLEHLAGSRGLLLDQLGSSADEAEDRPHITELAPSPPGPPAGAQPFHGFVPGEGWGQPEGPVPEAFLPAFHWGLAPVTRLTVPAPRPTTGRLELQALTYSEGQSMGISINGHPVLRHVFERPNQLEPVSCTLPLRAGDNLLELHYSQWLQSERDPRSLAVIFLSLQVSQAAGAAAV